MRNIIYQWSCTAHALWVNLTNGNSVEAVISFRTRFPPARSKLELGHMDIQDFVSTIIWSDLSFYRLNQMILNRNAWRSLWMMLEWNVSNPIIRDCMKSRRDAVLNTLWMFLRTYSVKSTTSVFRVFFLWNIAESRWEQYLGSTLNLLSNSLSGEQAHYRYYYYLLS